MTGIYSVVDLVDVDICVVYSVCLRGFGVNNEIVFVNVTTTVM